MPVSRVTLPPSVRPAVLLWPFPLLLLCLPLAAQGPRIVPGRTVPPPAGRIAARPVPAGSAADRRSVTLSREEYERLKAVARAAAKWQSAATAAAVVSEAHYTALVADGSATIGCRFVVHVLNGPWAEIPIDFGDAAVGVISTGKGTTAFLRGKSNGRFSLAVKETGRHEIRLELRAPVETRATGGRFSFSGPSAGISTLDVVIPTGGQRITVAPTFVPERATPEAGTSRVKGHLAAASTIAVSWQPQRSAAAAVQPTVTVDNRSRLRLREETLLTESKLTWQVHRGSLSSLSIVAPAMDRILDVSCTGGAMSGWTAEKQKGRQQIHVALSRAVTDRVVVTVRTERNLTEGTDSVAGRDERGDVFGIHAAQSDRETGLLALSHVPQWDVSVPSQSGWAPIDAEEIPGESTMRGSQYIRYFHPKTAFSIRIQPVKPRMTVVHDAGVAVRPSRIELTSRLQYQIDRIGVSSVSLRLPKGLTVVRVTGEHVKSFAVADPANLRVQFGRRVTGKTELTVHAHRSLAETPQAGEFELPVPHPDGVDRESGRIELSAADAVELVTVPEKTSGVTAVAISPAGKARGWRTSHAWSFDEGPWRITVQAKPRAPHISANLGTVVDVRESGTAVTSELEYHVEQAAARSFRFAVPTSIADAVRVTDAAGAALPTRKIGPMSVKTTAKKLSAGPAAKPADAEWTILEIEPSHPVVGKYRLKAQYELDPPKPGDGGKPVPWQPIRVLDVVSGRLHGEISVMHARPFQLTVHAHGGDVEPADGRELSFLPATDGVHFQYHREPVMLTIGIAKLDVETVADTVVSRGLVEIVFTGDSTAAYRARFRVRSSERQRLRLDLPKSCEPLGVFVNSAAVTLERKAAVKETEEWNSFLINVSRPQPSGEEFTLVVQFRMPVKPAPFQVPFGRLRMHLPRILNPQGTAAVVQQLRTVAWIPDGYALVGDAEDFTRQTTTRLFGMGPRGLSSQVDSGELEAWIGVGSPGVFAFPTQGHAYRFDSIGTVDQIEVATADMAFATWVLSVPLLLIGFVLARTTWHNRLNLVLLLLFAGSIAAVSWSDATYHALLAARYGLAAVVVLWAVHALFIATSRGSSGTAGSSTIRRGGPCPLPVAGLACVVIPPPGLFPEKSNVNP